MRKILLIFTFIFLTIGTLVQAQTTTTYAQRVANYYASFSDNGGGFDQGLYQLGQYANSNGAKQSVLWRKFRTDADGTATSDRSLKIGDGFTISLSATRAYGQIGFSLLASPSATTTWADRINNYALQVNLDGPKYLGANVWGNWYLTHNGGSATASSASGSTTFDSYSIAVALTAEDRMNVAITKGVTIEYFYDVLLNSSDPITDFSIYLEDDWNSASSQNIYWGLGGEGTQATLTNLGLVELGKSNETFTVSSVITDGLLSNSSSTTSVNNLTKDGSGTVTLSNDNTYTGTTSVLAGTLVLEGDLASSIVTVASGATLKIDGTVNLNAVTVQAGGFLEVLPGKSLTVTNNLINSGTFTLKSDGFSKPAANATGSLIVNGTITGDIAIELDIVGHGDVYDAGWHYISSPIDNYSVGGTVFEPTGTSDLYYWDELNYLWKNYEASSFDLVKEKGYLCAYTTDGTKTFTGNPNNSNVPISGLTLTAHSVDPTDNGWNLIGNPFTSAIAWDIESWTSSNIAATAKVWVTGDGNWDDITSAGTNIIPAMNGFMVQVSGGATGSLTIPSTARTHDATPWYKNNQESIVLKIYGGSNDFSDKVRVNFNSLATDEYDMQFDSHKYYGLETAPQLFTRVGLHKYSTNTFPNPELDREINLDFIPGTSGEHTIEVLENTVEGAESIYLHDLITNQMIDLNESSTYTFNAEVGDAQERFKLVFGATGIQETQKEALQAYVSGQNLYINGEEGQATLNIFDMQGKQLYNEKVELNSQYRKSLDLPQGIYVVSVQSNQVVKTAKVIIK